MRAEDLFEAMGGLDERLIARSDKRVRSAHSVSGQNSASGRMSASGRKRARRSKSKRSMGAEIYRFTVIAMSTAVVVFLFLIAKDFIGARKAADVRSRQMASSESDGGNGQEELMFAAEDDEQDEAESETEAAAEAAAEPTAEQNAEPAAESAAGKSIETSAGENETEKTAVDLLGKNKGDYVGLEYISAEEEANGGSRIVPEYSEEGEKALTRAFENGKAVPVIAVSTGEPTYYVYLTKKSGKVDKATFYENAYVSIDSVPGVVMKITPEEYEDVMELFR